MRHLFEAQLQTEWKIISSLAPSEVEPVCDFTPDGEQIETQARHQHCVELNVGLQGRCVFGFNTKYYRLEPGVCMLQTSKDIHDTGRSLGEEAYYGCIHFYPGYIYWEIFELRGTDYSSVCLREVPDFGMGWWMRDGFEHVRDMQLSSADRLRMLKHMLACVRLQLLSDFPDREPGPFPLWRYRIVHAMKRIGGSNGCNISAQELAQEAGYSKSHFLTLFAKVAECGFSEYVTRIRYAHYNKLRGQGATHKVIARQIGFASPEALSHWLNRQRRRDHID